MTKIMKSRPSRVVILGSIALLLAMMTGCQQSNSAAPATNEQLVTATTQTTDNTSNNNTNSTSTSSAADTATFTEEQVEQGIQFASKYKKDQYTVGEEYKQNTSPEEMLKLAMKKNEPYLTETQLQSQTTLRLLTLPMQLAVTKQSTLSPQDLEIHKKEPQTKQGVLQLSYTMKIAFANGEPSIPVEGELQLQPSADTWKVSYDAFNNKDLMDIVMNTKS
ncbi:hypothetical protein QE450_003549 [Paenibacillus sp. SORGH_AS306]|uniref:hypothetical protein n=1 Tax=unclassified Paenibacillus TaxID=185978 RepID=UPI002783C0E1|nr:MULTISPECIES: hypothetical protein [unclassified Paenibacillus]MDQ1236051.1 hypothetical protein [Paenibacillus sp. SORGH_AS_0306]MDR6108407.1 hypothetical protein [Paenibacillus sp. SORGH_AS_0338]